MSSSRCHGKARYETEWEAQSHLNRFSSEICDYSMVIYPCEKCGYWHIGHPAGTSMLHRIKAVQQSIYRGERKRPSRKFLKTAPRLGNTRHKLDYIGNLGFLSEIVVQHGNTRSWVELERSYAPREWVLTIGVDKKVVAWVFRLGDRECALINLGDDRTEYIPLYDHVYLSFRIREAIGA